MAWLIGILQGLGMIWAIVTVFLALACEPYTGPESAPISRYYPWWCAAWPLIAAAFIIIALHDIFSTRH